MRPSARALANRRNARRSAGPKTPAGKARVALNALRHGLAIPVTVDPALGAEIERLARAIAGRGVDPSRLECASRIAEAQVDLLRVRRARYALLADPSVRVKKPNARRLIGVAKRLLRGGEADEGGEAVMLALRGMNAQGDPPTLEAGIEALAAELARLDRYERRALSRRKTAIHNFDSLSAPQEAGREQSFRLGKVDQPGEARRGSICER
jgi:hypothetical protein